MFGYEKEVTKDIPKLCQELSKVLKLQIAEKDISDAYCLGNHEGCPIKLELVTYFKKVDILKNGRNLKGTGIFVKPDLTKKQQEEQKILKKHLKIIRQEEPEQNSYIRANKLYIDYKGYTSKELEEGAYVIKPKRLTQSAPPTPTINQLQEDEVFTNDKINKTNNQTKRQIEENVKETKDKETQNKPSKETPKRLPSTSSKPQVLKPRNLSGSSENKMTLRANKK